MSLPSVPGARPSPAPPAPDFIRVSEGKVLAGVCTGIAVHLGVRLTTVRLVFAVLNAIAGLGIVAYGALWVFTGRVDSPQEATNPAARASMNARGIDPAVVNRPKRGIDRAFVALAAILLIAGAATRPQVALSVLLLAGGVLLVWRTFGPDALSGGTGPTAKKRTPSGLQWASLFGGIVLLVIGIGYTVFGIGSDTSDGGDTDNSVIIPAIIAAFAMILGLVVVLIPLWLRLWSMASANARERAAEEERTRIASRIHDSVLQTLTLIQKKSDDPEIAQLARSQERQLRQWLFAPDESVRTETVFGALRVACGEVEDTFGVQIRPVIVGEDREATEQDVALLLAGREAMVNAAKHSGCSEINVYLEITGGTGETGDTGDTVELFIRDRGPGFVVDEIPADRQGVRSSILDRMERAGGTVEIETGGFGTEVILRTEGQGA